MFLKVIRGIRNHPKKTIFFSGLFAFGGNFLKQKYDDECLMRAYCEEALKYGEVSYKLTEAERHITVILNPAACEGKGKNKYEKFCAPLLHLAGMKVALVRTEYEGQAKEIMNIMDNTDAVIVAGGDGTLSEILTGLLRRDDSAMAVKRFPIGILPLGEKNLVTSNLWGFENKPKVKHLAESTMAVIRSIMRPLDVVEITPLEEDNSPSKPVYAVSELEWGAFRDAKERKSIYWYWAFLKKYMVYVFSSYKDLAWDCNAEMNYASPCPGCSRCKNETTKKREQITTKRWWHAFLPRPKSNNIQETIDYSKINNPDCGKLESLDINGISDLLISTCNSSPTKDIPGYALSVKLGKENLSSWDFIKEGWSREFGKEAFYDKEYLVGEFTITPKVDAMTDKEGNVRKLSIDNDLFEVRPMKIRPLYNAVNIFALPKNKTS